MRRAPEILGILSVIFGSLTTIVMVLVAVLLDSTPARSEAERIYGIANTTALVALSLWLFAIGIGLLLRRRWARAAGIVWAILALAVNDLEFFVSGSVLHETRTIGTYVVLVVDSLFPLAMLWLLGRRSAAADFTSPAWSTTRR